MERLLNWIWSWPFAALFLCCYLVYRWNLRPECRNVQLMYDGQKQKEMIDPLPLPSDLRRCFFQNLAQAAGRMNPCVVGIFLFFGGAGGLFWMAVFSPLCVVLRFAQLNLLARPVEEETEGRGEVLLCREGSLTALLQHHLWEEMHLTIGRLLSRGLPVTGLLLTLSMVNTYGMAHWMSDRLALPFEGIVGGQCLLTGLAAWGQRCGGRRRDRTMTAVIVAYAVVLGILLLCNLRSMTLAISGILSDGLQIPMYTGPLFGRGVQRAVMAGAAMSCYAGGLTEEAAAKSYLRCLRARNERDGRDCLLTAGRVTAAETVLSILGIGFGTGLLLVCRELRSLQGVWFSGQHRLPGPLGPIFFVLAFVLVIYGAGREMAFRNASADSVVGSRQIALRTAVSWVAVVVLRRVLPRQGGAAMLLLLAMWPVLLIHFMSWIGLSFRFRRLWADSSEMV